MSDSPQMPVSAERLPLRKGVSLFVGRVRRLLRQTDTDSSKCVARCQGAPLYSESAMRITGLGSCSPKTARLA